VNIRNVVGAVWCAILIFEWAYVWPHTIAVAPILLFQMFAALWLLAYRNPPPPREYTLPNMKGDVCAHGIPMTQHCPNCED
jgi:hypothetical protein